MSIQVEFNRRDQILTAAREVFSDQGYNQASIKKIAAQARLNSPALIYWYFESKADLFAAVLSETSMLLQEINANRQLVDLPPQEALELLAKSFIETFDCLENKRIFRIWISESTRSAEVSDHFAAAVISPVRDFLVPYFQKKIDEQVMRQHNPEVSARVFAGTLVHIVLCDEIFPHVWDCRPLSNEYIHEIVKIFLDGLTSDRS
jgi:AcrR family transcriptional regulator